MAAELDLDDFAIANGGKAQLICGLDLRTRPTRSNPCNTNLSTDILRSVTRINMDGNNLYNVNGFEVGPDVSHRRGISEL